MDFETIEALAHLIGLIADEVETDDISTEDVMKIEVAIDPAVQQAMVTIAKRTYEILGSRIDADRMGEIVKESELSPDYFDKHISNL